MDEEILNAIRKVGKFFRGCFLGLILTILIIGWFVIGGINLYCAVSHGCDTSSITWWNMLISVLSFPILAVQLYLLRKTVEDGIWKPELSIGFVNSPISPVSTMKADVLSRKVEISFDYLKPLFIKYDNELMGGENLMRIILDSSQPRLIIRNKGKTTAKSIKVQISLSEIPIQQTNLKIWLGSVAALNLLRTEIEENIHPEDFIDFSFYIHPEYHKNFSETDKKLDVCFDYFHHADRLKILNTEGTEQPYPHLFKRDKTEIKTIDYAHAYSNCLVFGKYTYEVKVWADGMVPVTEKIVIIIRDFSEEFKNLIKEIASEAENYEKIYKKSVIDTD